MKKSFIVGVLLLVVVFAGCAKTQDVTSNQVNDDYVTIGQIIAFEKEGVHILTGDIAEVFKVDKEDTKDFYLGETVGVVKVDENKYKLEKYKIENFDIRHNTMGEVIFNVFGKVKKVNKEEIIITTEEENLKFELYEEVSLEQGTEVIVEYLKREEENILIDIYNENSKINLIVKKISRAENTGIMVLDTEDKDGIKYMVYVLGETVLNFNHTDLKEEDKITVYPEVIRESYPAQIDAKMIKK